MVLNKVSKKEDMNHDYFSMIHGTHMPIGMAALLFLQKASATRSTKINEQIVDFLKS
jgi:hypothetical protein